MKSIVLFVALWGFALFANAQLDSIVVIGKVENLTARQYRRASTVTAIRNNILNKYESVVCKTELAADGSFRLVVPIIFPNEEIHVLYGEVFAPILASPKSTVNLTIWGDSLGKVSVPFRFGGYRADINNDYAQYNVFERQALERRKDVPKSLPEKLGSQNPVQAFETLDKIRTIKNEIWANFNTQYSIKSALSTWVLATINDEFRARYNDYLVGTRQVCPANFSESVTPTLTSILTFAKARAFFRFSDYVHQELSSIVLANQAKNQKYNKLLLAFNKNDKTDINWPLKQHQVYTEYYANNYNLLTNNYLQAQFLPTMRWAYNQEQIDRCYQYIRADSLGKYFDQSLDEFYAKIIKDTVAINQLEVRTYQPPNKDALGTYAIDALPGMDFCHSIVRTGDEIMSALKRQFRGRLIYLIPWQADSFIDNKELNYASHLQAQFPPSKIVFVYVCSNTGQEQLWRNNAVRSHARGLHLYLTPSQMERFASQIPHNFPFQCGFMDSKGSGAIAIVPYPSEEEAAYQFVAKRIEKD